MNESEIEIFKNEPTELITNKNFQIGLGSSLELINQIKNDDLNNGVALLKSDHFKFIPGLLAKYCIQKYNTKRVLVLDWDIDHNVELQNEFYTSQKLVNFFCVTNFVFILIKLLNLLEFYVVRCIDL